MLALDVNVLAPALHVAAADHVEMRTWVESAVVAAEPLGVSEAVLTGVLRIVTHPRIFKVPATVESGLTLIRSLIDQPGVEVLSSGAQYLDILDRLCRATGVRGNDVADAGHAATAIAHDATFVTKDRGFARFPGLRWTVPGRFSG